MTSTNEEIYVMPSFAQLSATDVEVSSRWYREVLGFKDVFTMAPQGGKAIMAHLRWVKYADLMLVASRAPEDRTRGVGVNLYFQLGETGKTVDQLADAVRAQGGTIVEQPGHRPWNTREVTFADPDGYRLTFTQVIDKGRKFQEVVGKAGKTEG